MAKRIVTRTAEIPLLDLRASFVPSTVDADRRTVELTWTTGAAVLRGGFFTDPFYEELSLDPAHVKMGRLKSGAAPLLNTHSQWDIGDVIGVVESAALEEKRGTAVVRFDRGAAGEDAFRKVSDGILRNVSVGYQVHKMEQVDPGNPEKKKPPTYRVVSWTPYELSMVPIGADAGAMTRSAHGTARTNPCEIIEERTMEGNDETHTDATKPDDVEASVALAATEAARKKRIDDARERAANEQQAAEEATAATLERVAAIQEIAERADLGTAWATKLIKAGVSIEAARTAAFAHLTSKDKAEFNPDGTLRVHAGEDENDKYIRGAAAWLIERTGKRKQLETAKVRAPELFGDLEFGGGASFRGLSPLELARESLERRGFRTRGMPKMEMLGHAFTYRAGAMQTTSDFANILENVLHKMLLGAYAIQETTWQVFCGTEDVPDFRSSTRYRTGSLPSLPKILEHGEYTTGAIPDAAKYTISTERHGEIFALSREVIVNDDMGALANLAMEFGRASARTIENDVYALLALNSGAGPTMSDSNPFFHSSRGNVGTGAAISVASLDADRVLMRAQKDPNGKDYLSLRPVILLVPDALEGTARVINLAQYDPDTANKLQRPNMVQGLFRDIIGSPRLASNTTRRYLFADPTIAAAFVVAFLEGYGRGPIMESQTGWRTDGIEWRVTQYAKAQPADPKGAVTNAGV